MFSLCDIRGLNMLLSHSAIFGASRPDGIPYGFADLFFFEILQNHTYGHASGRGKKWFG